MSLDSKLRDLGKHNNRVPGWIRAIIIIPAAVYIAYSWYNASGLYMWIAKLQMSIMDKYYPMLTGLLTIIAVLLPAVVLISIISLRYRPKDENIPENDLSMALEKFSITRPGLFKLYILSLMIAVGAGSVAIYLYICYGFMSATPILTDINTTDLVEKKSSEYITMTTRLQCDYSYSMLEGDSRSKTEILYVPVSDAEGKFKNMFLLSSVYGKRLDCIDTFVPLTGIIRPGGLPGMIRDAYIKEGIIGEDDNYSLIEDKASPGNKKSLADGLLIMAAIGVIGFLLIHFKFKPVQKIS
jgi:hypothetical protein